MTAPDGSSDLLVGEVVAVRTFELRADGRLWPVFAADQPWVDSVNTASCRDHTQAGAIGCVCGFWAYGSVRAAREQAQARTILAVLSCWGRITPGTRGLRAQHARIDAVWLSTRVSATLAAKVAANYPSAKIYRSCSSMLREHPLTTLPSYGPARSGRGPRAWARRARPLVTVGALVLGVLPELIAHPHAVMLAVYGWFLLTLLLMSAAALLMAALARGPVLQWRRRAYFVIAGQTTALWLWILAPALPLAANLLLRLPAAYWLGRYIISATVRYLPPTRGRAVVMS